MLTKPDLTKGDHYGFSIDPLYLQLRNKLHQRLAGGEWKPGAHLPNEHVLAEEYDVSHGTVRKALDTLEREGFLRRVQGRGTIVIDTVATTDARVRGCYVVAHTLIETAAREASPNAPLDPVLLETIKKRVAGALVDAGKVYSCRSEMLKAVPDDIVAHLKEHMGG